MLNFNSILVFSGDPGKLAGFYEKVFKRKPDWSEGGYYGFKAGEASLTFGPHDKVKGRSKEPERIMLNFETEDVRSEFVRIKGLGAEPIAEPYQMEGHDGWIATFADPDGNFFQLMTPWKDE